MILHALITLSLIYHGQAYHQSGILWQGSYGPEYVPQEIDEPIDVQIGTCKKTSLPFVLEYSPTLQKICLWSN